jgi:hypothetical protein
MERDSPALLRPVVERGDERGVFESRERAVVLEGAEEGPSPEGRNAADRRREPDRGEHVAGLQAWAAAEAFLQAPHPLDHAYRVLR